jgi:hypothetical protein
VKGVVREFFAYREPPKINKLSVINTAGLFDSPRLQSINTYESIMYRHMRVFTWHPHVLGSPPCWILAGSGGAAGSVPCALEKRIFNVPIAFA